MRTKFSELFTIFWAWLTRPPAHVQLVSLMQASIEAQRENQKVQQEMVKIFGDIVGAWTRPVPISSPPPSQSDIDALDALEQAAEAGDPDAQALIADEKSFRHYMSQFS